MLAIHRNSSGESHTSICSKQRSQEFTSTWLGWLMPLSESIRSPPVRQRHRPTSARLCGCGQPRSCSGEGRSCGASAHLRQQAAPDQARALRGIVRHAAPCEDGHGEDERLHPPPNLERDGDVDLGHGLDARLIVILQPMGPIVFDVSDKYRNSGNIFYAVRLDGHFLRKINRMRRQSAFHCARRCGTAASIDRSEQLA